MTKSELTTKLEEAINGYDGLLIDNLYVFAAHEDRVSLGFLETVDSVCGTSFKEEVLNSSSFWMMDYNRGLLGIYNKYNK